MRVNLVMFLGTALLIFIPGQILADTGVADEWAPAESATPSPPSLHSDAQFDKRLPPVLPGERLSDDGRPIKVWSSSGPVPVGTVAQPGQPSQTMPIPDGVSVIVDGREGRASPRR